MTKKNHYFIAASVSALVGMAAFADDVYHYSGTRYPDAKSSSANTNSATSGRLQDPTNPAGAYDTDKSGYANRWNAESRITAQPYDQTHLGTAYNDVPGTSTNYRRTTTTDRVTTARSSADMDSRTSVDNSVNRGYSDHEYHGAYTGGSGFKDTDQYSGVNSDLNRDSSRKSFSDTDRTSVNTSMSGAATDAEYKADRTGDKIEHKADRAGDKMEHAADKADHKMHHAADNSGLNKRDRDENADTADKQASTGTKSDTDVTRQIRRELTRDDSLSTYGKNVKIISKNGTVTLRGPVASSEEKDKIETAAGKIVGTQKVRNELEIKH